MIMFASISFIQALASPGIIPLILTFIAAAIDYHFDNTKENKRNARRRARWMFIVTGVAGTIASVYLYAQAQQSAETAAEQQTQTQSALLTAMETIESEFSNRPPATASSQILVTSNRLANIQTIMLAMKDQGSLQSQATSRLIEEKIVNANKLLSFREKPAVERNKIPVVAPEKLKTVPQ